MRSSLLLAWSAFILVAAVAIGTVRFEAQADCLGACQKVRDVCLETCAGRESCVAVCQSEFKRCTDECGR